MELELDLALIITHLVIAAALFFSAAGYFGRFHKYLELASHFRVQYLLASIFCLSACLMFQDWGWAIAAAVGAAINLAAIAPWYAGKRSSNNGIAGHRLNIVFANVYRVNKRREAFIAFVLRHQPDIVIAQEVDAVWSDALRPLHDQYPFFEVLPRGGGSGMAIFSRLAFERLEIVLPEGEGRPGILVRLNAGGSAVSLLSIHPRAPIRRGHLEQRNKMLVAAASYLQNLPAPKICVGDLNTSLWSPYYRSFAKQTNLVNVRQGFGLLPSWPTFLFFRWLMIPIDHCLVSADIRVIRARTGEPIGSDHLPLVVEIEIPLSTGQ
ncbi:MAG: endonuclease/exonuclease/phosphatase family protein [Blastocatellia bacterium]